MRRLLVPTLLAGAFAACHAPGAEAVVSEMQQGEVQQDEVPELAAGESGVALFCAKVVTMDGDNRVFDPGLIVVRAGKIAYVGEPTDVPAGYERREFPELWASPGMVDLHSHIQSTGWWDTNDMVLPINADLRVTPGLDPWEERIPVANAGGVTTLFGIPGSGTSISGFGTLYKTKTDGGFEGMILKDPGGVKSAFNFNPQRGGGDLGSSWAGLTWNVHQMNDRVAYQAKQEDPAGHEDWQIENMKRVHRGELPVLIHCASAEGVAGVVRTWKLRYGTTCIVSHGSWDGHMAAAFCAEHGVPVNHGPRIANYSSMIREEKIQGGAQSFVDAGVPDFSLNTDAPVLPQQELFLQGTMSARLGADAYQMLQAVTINPARSFLIGDRVGSLEVGKDADVLITTGDPLDPRSRVEVVFIDGEVQYTRRDGAQVF